jgi:RNA polymerase sigma-70 factor, ECF subfamily
MASPDASDFRPGSREDFDRLYRLAYPRLLRTVYGVLGDASAAEDCVQDAFLRAFRAWARFRPDRSPEAWLHRIAVNLAISHWRRRRLQDVGELLRRLGRPGPGPDPAEAAARSDVVAALAALPPRLSSTFVLRHYHGYTNREIAAITGVSERSVGSRLAESSRRLRERLGAEWDRELPRAEPSRVSHTSVSADA